MKNQEVVGILELLQGCGLDFFDRGLDRVEYLLVRDGTTFGTYDITEGMLLRWRKDAAVKTAAYWVTRIERGAGERHDDFVRYLGDTLEDGHITIDRVAPSWEYLEKYRPQAEAA